MTRAKAYHHGDLRAALVTGALDLIADKGITGLSVAEVARRVGVSTAAPYRHFASRTALLSAAATEAARQLSDQMRDAADTVRESGVAHDDPVTDAVETLAALAAVHVRYALERGAAFDLILADELRAHPDERRREATRALFDQLLWPAMTLVGDVHGANPLLRSFAAVVHGFASMPRGDAVRDFPVDLRGFASERELVADEAARTVRTLARAATGR